MFFTPGTQRRFRFAGKRFVALLNDKGELNEATLFGFAKQRKYEETVAALAELSQSTIEVVRPLMQIRPRT